jgi:catechol 2,3-dioxygenase-like lactoylglutathione lyase family enzyme
MLSQARLQPMVSTMRPDAARDFYTAKLGLKLLFEDTFALIFEVGDGTLRVSKAPAVTPSTYAVLAFAVTDIAADVGALVKAGIVMERYSFFQQDELGVWAAPDGTKVAWFRDADGNLLSVVQHKT